MARRDTKFVAEWAAGGSARAPRLRTGQWQAVLRLESGRLRNKYNVILITEFEHDLRTKGPKWATAQILMGLANTLAIVDHQYYASIRRVACGTSSSSYERRSSAEMEKYAKREPVLLMCRSAFGTQSLLEHWRHIAKKRVDLMESGAGFVAIANWFIEAYKVRLTFPDELLVTPGELRIED